MSKERKPIDTGAEEQAKPLKRRKKGGCLKKLLITLGITVGVLAVLIVGGLFISDAVMKSQVGVSLFDVFGAIGDIGNYDRDEIVTNPYGDEDVAGFYDAANGTLFFKTGDEAVLDSEYIRDLLGEATGGGDITASLLDMLSSDNFDTEKLAAFTGWKDGSSVTATVTDRQFAAFLDDLVFGSGYIDSMLPDSYSDMLGDASLGDLATLEQIIVTDVPDSDSVTMKLTMSLDINKTIDTVLPNLPDDAGMVKSLGWLFKFLLPDETFVSATVDLSDASAGMDLELNALSQETCGVTAREEILSKYDTDGDGQVTKMDRLFIIIESFSGADVRQVVDDAASGVLGYICKSDDGGFSLADAIDLGGVTSSASGTSLPIDMYGMLAGAMNAQTGGSATANDIIVLMQALICSDPAAYSDVDFLYRSDYYYNPSDAKLAAALEECGFSSLSDVVTLEDYEKLCAAYGGEPYTEAGATTDGLESVYKDMFMAELEEVYCLDLDGYTFDDVVALFGITADGSASSAELTDLIDGTKLAEAAAADETEPLRITDRMLGAILTELMPQFIGEDLAGCDITPRALRIEKTTAGDVTHDLVTVTFTLDLTPMLGESADYLSGILPQRLTLAVTADMTPGLAEEDRAAAELTCFNDINAAGTSFNGLTTDYLLSALERVVPDLDMDSLLADMASGMASVSDNMAETLPGFSFAATEGAEGYAELPEVFMLAADILGLSEGDGAVSGEELKSATDYLVNYEYTGEDNAASADYVDFLMSVQEHYYVAPQLGTFDSVFDNLTDGSSSYLFRTEPTQYTYTRADGTQVSVDFDGYVAGETHDDPVELTEKDLLAVLVEKIADGEGFASAREYAELIDASITADDTIALDIRLATGGLLEERYASVFDCEYIYARLTVDVGSPAAGTDGRTYYVTDIELNGEGAGGADYDAVMRILARFGVSGFDLDAVAEDVGAATYDVFEMFDNAKLTYTFADGAITFPTLDGYMAALAPDADAA